MRIKFGHRAKALFRSSPHRLTDEANNLNISVFFGILFGGQAFADLHRPSFGCNEANERLTLLHLSSLLPLLLALFFIPPLLSSASPATLRSFPLEYRLRQVWSRLTLNARLGP
jgi:hypothetical protein